MELHGSLEDNLISAIRSVERFRGRRVYQETLSYWESLCSEARRELAAGSPRMVDADLLTRLEDALAERANDTGGTSA